MSTENQGGGERRADLSPEDKAAFERRIAGLDKRLGEVKAREAAETKASASRSSQNRGMAYGFRMASELVAAVLVGGLIGYALDHFLGTKPWLFLVMFILGFAAGVTNVMRSYDRVQKEVAKTTGGNIGHAVPDDKDD